jgi:AcrR family transcriptional regulator
LSKSWQDTRENFRHGNLADALLEAALVRLEAAGADSLSLRELARDAGVNHRAVYRHFPDKLSLLARVAEAGWVRLAARIKKRAAGKAPGEETLVAAGVTLFVFARDKPSLFQLMSGPRLNTDGKFARLATAIETTLHLFMQAFLDAGTDAAQARKRTVVFVASLQGVIQQILQRRYRVASRLAEAEVADICRMLIKGLS